MELLPISITNSGLHIEGFPDAQKLIKLSGPHAKRLADLSMHSQDLDLVAQCLEAINRVPQESRLERQGLWRCAVVSYFKCFKHSAARTALNEQTIYGAEPDGLEVFKYFEALRDKHLVHDENTYAQSIPAAVLNKEGKEPKIAKIVCLSAFAETLRQEDWSNLSLLIQKAKGWVESEFDSLCARITAGLEAESYESLSARKEVEKLQLPKVEDIGKIRRTP